MQRIPFWMVCFLLLFNQALYGQYYKLGGKVTDEEGKPLGGAHIHLSDYTIATDPVGEFEFRYLKSQSYRIIVSYLGYQTRDTTLVLDRDLFLSIRLKPEESFLEEVVLKISPTNGNTAVSVVKREEIQDNFSGSLAKSLERLPGVNVTEIGAGASKPIIRGLGFNRVLVTENGIRHEGQQWGADHGLEIDALSSEEIRVVRGAGTIEYGSDAMGGVLEIRNNNIPAKNILAGEYLFFGRTINNNLTHAFSFQQRKDRFFYKFRGTVTDYGDYRIPSDTIVYLSVKMPVAGRHLKNTAGRERNWMAQAGYVSDFVQSVFTISHTYFKAGFFPGAHGVPSIRRVEDDGDRRDIDFPFQRVAHLKIMNQTKWYFDKGNLNFLASYQNNHRQEWSEFHTHYANQPRPETDPDLELNFNLYTLEAQVKYSRQFSEAHESAFGIQGQYQSNSIRGYNFLLPAFSRNTAGVFVVHTWKPSAVFEWDLGMRADFAAIDIQRFYDPLLYQYLISRGRTEEQAQAFAERSKEVSRNFSAWNTQTTARYHLWERWTLQSGIGTVFRFPTAIELASNGIHHGSFRHEQGDPNLSPEQGLTADMGVVYKTGDWQLSLSPYVYYFTNYIFLQPQGAFSPLPHGGQLYRYTQSEALLTGIEVSAETRLFDKLSLYTAFEYLYNQQLTGRRSQNRPLPFSPPANAFAEVRYEFPKAGIIKTSEIFINTRWTASQSRIAQNEVPTPGYQLLGGGLKAELQWGNFQSEVMLQAVNIFDVRYLNHTSFYRALEIPEMGRNIQLMIKIPFGGNG